MTRYSEWYTRNRRLVAVIWVVAAIPSTLVVFAMDRNAGILVVVFMVGIFFLGERTFRRPKN